MKADYPLRLMLLALVIACASAGCSDLSGREVHEAAQLTGGGNAVAGRDDIVRYGCDTCHTVSGVPEARGLIGPPLDGIASRSFIAGELPNTPENLMRWVEHPRQINPHTLMPEMGVGEQESRDIAAYLYTLH
jgi:cytochrome c